LSALRHDLSWQNTCFAVLVKGRAVSQNSNFPR
jgi:hypothetical protein